MVITFNPSHTNVNNETNAPFKILSLLIRYLENESHSKKPKKIKDNASDDYKMQRNSERLDTIEGEDEEGDYGDEMQGDDNAIDVNLDDIVDDDEEDEDQQVMGGFKVIANLLT